jgi:hypothetical protein
LVFFIVRLFLPVVHALFGSRQIAGGYCSPLVANSVQQNNPSILHEKPENPGIELAHMAQFKKSAPNRLGQRLAVVSAITQLC